MGSCTEIKGGCNILKKIVCISTLDNCLVLFCIVTTYRIFFLSVCLFATFCTLYDVDGWVKQTDYVMFLCISIVKPQIQMFGTNFMLQVVHTCYSRMHLTIG